jgi:hypothetical protein
MAARLDVSKLTRQQLEKFIDAASARLDALCSSWRSRSTGGAK